jgi:hypothetical protein
MPLDVVRLRDSDLTVLASGDAFRAAVLLWCASWHQVPAASLPTDDRLLASLAGYGRDMKGWSQVREDALRGFVECSDGRLYHPVVAEKALEACEYRKAQKERTRKATDARRSGKRDGGRNDERHGQNKSLRIVSIIRRVIVTMHVTRPNRQDRNRQDQTRQDLPPNQVFKNQLSSSFPKRRQRRKRKRLRKGRQAGLMLHSAVRCQTIGCRTRKRWRRSKPISA